MLSFMEEYRAVSFAKAEMEILYLLALGLDHLPNFRQS
jgi:hypothetical protein